MNRNNIHRATLSMAIALTTGTNALASGIDIQAGQTVSLSGITADMEFATPAQTGKKIAIGMARKPTTNWTAKSARSVLTFQM